VKIPVLIVDDDVVSRMVLMHLVDSCADAEITEAEDGQDAWDRMQAGLRPAIVFCDLRMPRMSGMELLRRVRAEPGLAETIFVLVTSATDHDTVEQARDYGVSGYLVKPFQPGDVTAQMALTRGPEDSEPPMATMQRLGISRERLLVYVGGLQSQLQAAGGEFDALFARADQAGVVTRLEKLEQGCATLGLHGAVRALAQARSGACDAPAVRAALETTQRVVAQRTEDIRRIC